MQEVILEAPKPKLGKIKLMPFSKFRQYRAELQDHSFKIIKDRINCARDLVWWIKELKPINIYASTACNLNPVRVRGYKKSSYQWADKIILSHDVLVDIDLPGQAGLIEAAKTIEFMKGKPNYQLQRILSTGGGYHVIFNDTKQLNIANPEERSKEIKLRRTALKNELLKAGINFDALENAKTTVLDDLFRVSRVCGSWNGNKNKLCYEIPLSHIPISSEEASLGERAGAELKTQKVEARPVYIDRFISNKVPGLKDRYAMVFMWNENVNYKKFLTKSDMDLGKVSIFKFGKMIQGISSKTVSAVRLTKILYETRSLNINSWLKYNHCWVYLGRKEVQSVEVGKEIMKLAEEWKISQIALALKMDVPQFIEVVDCSPATYFASLPHEKAIEFLSGSPSTHQLLHGDSKIKEHLVLR